MAKDEYADKLASVFSDQVRIEKLMEAIHRIDSSVVAMAERIGAVKRQTEETVGSVSSGVEGVTEKLKETKEVCEDITEFSEKTLTTWDKISQTLKGLDLDGIGRKFQQIGQSMVSMQSSAQGTVTSLVSSIPYIGPFLQLMLNARIQQSQFETLGKNTLLGFRQNEELNTSDVLTKGSALGRRMQEMEKSGLSYLASGADVAAVWKAFSDGGIKSTEVMKDANFEIQGFGRSVDMVATGLERAFGLVAGSVGTSSVQLLKNTNLTLSESVDLVRDLGLASRESGMTTQAFINTILQATSAMRVQGGDAKSLANTYFALKDAVKNAMGGMGSEQRHADLASAALGNLPQQMQSMPKGMQVYIAEMLSQVTGGGLKGLNALHHFQTGFQFAPDGQQWDPSQHGDLAVRTAEAKYKFLQSQGLSGWKLVEAMNQFGGDPLTSMLIHARKGNLSGSDVERISTERQKELDKAAKQQPITQGGMEGLFKELEQLMNNLGLALISVLSAILNGMVGGFLMVAKLMMKPSISEAISIGKSYGGMMLEHFDKVKESASPVLKNLKNIKEGAGDEILNAFGGQKTEEFWSKLTSSSSAEEQKNKKDTFLRRLLKVDEPSKTESSSSSAGPSSAGSSSGSSGSSSSGSSLTSTSTSGIVHEQTVVNGDERYNVLIIKQEDSKFVPNVSYPIRD